MYDIIIVGAGPAGLTAAIYARRASKKVLVLEAKNYGGQIINTLDIENYPVESHISGFDFATKLYNQVKDLGAEIIYEKVVDIKDNHETKEVITTKNKYVAKAIILATGSENRKLGIENENELALEDALYLTDIANKVYLIHRRDEFRGAESTLNLLKDKDNIEFIYNSNVTKLNANEKLQSIEITNKDGSKRIIEVEGLFIAVGRIPENENFRKLIKLDNSGYIIAGENCNTNVRGIFVAGDNRTKEVRQLVTATSDGAIAATEAIKFINNEATY